MTCLSCLADEHAPLILDASVLINLKASSHGRKILLGIPNEVFVSEIVVHELGYESIGAGPRDCFIHELITQEVIKVVKLGDTGYQVYEQLICGYGSLDDGEAATIAAAVEYGYIPIIDERKGRARAETLLSGVAIAWSLDVFLHPTVKTSLPEGGYIQAIYLALRHGRMRIDEQRCDVIARLIGFERALVCTCLPKFKVRKKIWENEHSQ